MTVRAARAITYLVVAVLAVFAMRATPPIAPPVAQVLSDSVAKPSWELPFDTVARGETLVGVLERGGLSDTAAGNAVQAATSINPRRIPAGMRVAVINASPSDSEPTEIVLQLAADHFLHLIRGAAGWTEKDERLPWKTDTLVIQGTIHSNLYQAVYAAADSLLPRDAQDAVVVQMADNVYQYRVDMSRDLQNGDSFRVMVPRSVASNGTVRIGDIVAAQLVLSGTTIDAVHYTNDKVQGDYFDQKGRSLKAAFLRVPLRFKYISSAFGNRFHPILKLWRDHKGIDYAANAGTPVRAIGNGVVVRAGWASGYGNLIEIRHPNGFSSRYGHLRAFASGIHAGARVSIGETIGFVGMTGLATGPHLHFEFLVHGVQRDPRLALRNVGGEPIPTTQVAQFDQVRDRVLAELQGSGDDVTTLAQR
ncbi:MAG TPA: M23 family metallopeptidase [Gemmatimonadaceae bacterium]|nr:M23 family metallopeptidase [Gemmatimonadaceae bacterium]